MRAIVTHSRPLPIELRLPNLGATQRPRDRSIDVSGSAAEPAHHLPQRERKGARRAEHQQRAGEHPDKAGGRDREHPGPQIHAVPDPEGGGVLHTSEEADKGKKRVAPRRPPHRCREPDAHLWKT